jgi:hypothetical protein
MVISERYRQPRVAAFLLRGLSEREPAEREATALASRVCITAISVRADEETGAYHTGSHFSINPEAAREAVLPGTLPVS